MIIVSRSLCRAEGFGLVLIGSLLPTALSARVYRQPWFDNSEPLRGEFARLPWLD